jgi:hypothetical protein
LIVRIEVVRVESVIRSNPNIVLCKEISLISKRPYLNLVFPNFGAQCPTSLQDLHRFNPASYILPGSSASLDLSHFHPRRLAHFHAEIGAETKGRWLTWVWKSREELAEDTTRTQRAIPALLNGFICERHKQLEPLTAKSGHTLRLDFPNTE